MHEIEQVQVPARVQEVTQAESFQGAVVTGGTRRKEGQEREIMSMNMNGIGEACAAFVTYLL